MTLNRPDVVERVAERAQLSRAQADAALTAVQDVLADALRDGVAVRIPGLLVAEPTERAARTGRHPRTGEPLEIPAGRGVRLAPGSVLKAAVRA
ncbi:integration host factor [Cellulomonas sp. APG4]|uniref:HU family DNA-binding protein n=1 Tax=Cellulomonas sp. APG4 TaxID=1538656 RepID=UPI00137AAF83|nr:HU family DNA-binding protein [Cellulomonas sp. APG4]NCT91547.1 integration host factor [Cellulomonas sp. APG4]